MIVERPLPAAVIFDMDGVLSDTEPFHAEAYVGIWNEMGLKCTLADYQRMVTLGRMTVDQVFISLGGDMSAWPALVDDKHARIRQRLDSEGALRPGVIELLTSLREARVPTAIATLAGHKSVQIIMDRFALDGYFDRIVAWQDVSRPKPDPEVYLKAAESLNVEPARCVALEDSPRGVTAAIAAGMKCIAIPVESTAQGDFSSATLVVRSLEEVDLYTLRGLV